MPTWQNFFKLSLPPLSTWCVMMLAGMTVLLLSLLSLGVVWLWFDQPFGYTTTITSLILSILALMCVGQREGASCLQVSGSVLSFLMLLCVCIWLNSAIWDTSWDGRWYHQEMVLQLGQGWNPLLNPTLPEPALMRLRSFFLFYPKGAELIQAQIWCVIHHIECAKMTNIWMFLASLLAVVGYLNHQPQTVRLRNRFLALLCVFNPVVLCQLFTFYVDGWMASGLTTLLFLWLWWAQTKQNTLLLLMGAVTIVVINLKLTAIFVVLGLMGSGILREWLIKKTRDAQSLAAVTLVALLMGIVIIGVHPYMTNAFVWKAPLYPIRLKTTWMTTHRFGFPVLNVQSNNVDTQTNPYFLRQPSLYRYVWSYFSETSNTLHSLPVLKSPLQLSQSEWQYSQDPDIRFGGFGPFFSAILLLTILRVFWIAFPLKSTDKTFFLKQPEVWALGCVILICLSFPELWWARLMPLVWLIPWIAEWLCLQMPFGWLGRVINTTSLWLGFFTVIWFTTALYPVWLHRSQAYKLQLHTLAIQSQIQPIWVDFWYFRSNRQLWTETGIHFIEVPGFLSSSCHQHEFIPFSHSWVCLDQKRPLAHQHHAEEFTDFLTQNAIHKEHDRLHHTHHPVKEGGVRPISGYNMRPNPE